MTELEQKLEAHRQWSKENLIDPSLPYLLLIKQNHLFYRTYSRLFAEVFTTNAIRRIKKEGLTQYEYRL